MGMQLPDELRFALEILGMEWPATDEEVVANWANDWRALAAVTSESALDLSHSVRSLAERNEGEGLTAFMEHIHQADSALTRCSELSQGCMALATACEAMSQIVLGLKMLVVTHLISLALSIAAAVSSGGAGAAAVLVAKQAAKEAISWAVAEGVATLLDE